MVDEVTNDWIEHYKNPKNRHGIAWELALAGFLPHGVDPNNPGVIEILNSDKQKMSDIDRVLQALKRSYLFQVNCELTEVESKMLLELIDGLRFAVNEQPELEARIAELEAKVTRLLTESDDAHMAEARYIAKAELAKRDARIVELEGESERFTVHSDIERQDDKSSNDTQTQTIVYGKERK